MVNEGQKIGKYTLIRKIGRGGFGEVWLAEKSSEGFRTFTKKVAVKLPHSAQVDFHAIEQEAMLWEQVSGHPNVLPIIDADIFDGQILIVSEYADGGSLADRLEREGHIPIRQAIEMTIGILSGLDFLHSKRIIHRDIKPANILLQGDTPRLADFGISRAMNTTTISSNIVGTDAYMSPEALDGKRSVQTDIWSVGVVLYEMIKGSLPFPQEHPSERMFAILMKEMEPLSIDFPFQLREIIRQALAKKPEERYSSANAMRADLQKLSAELSHLSHLPTEIIPKNEIATAKALVNTNEQDQMPETVPPKRLKEIGEISREIEPTPTAAAHSPLPTQPVFNNSNPSFKPLQPEPRQFAETARTANPKTSLFLSIGAVFLLLLGGGLGLGYWMLNKDQPISQTGISNVTVNANKNAVLQAEKIRIGSDMKGFVSSNNKMIVDLQIKGLGDNDVIEEIRKNDNLEVEINGQPAKIMESIVANGSILKVRTETELSIESAKTFRDGKQQDFAMAVTISYQTDVVAKRIETKYQKGKGASSLGDPISFGDLEEQNTAPPPTKPVVSNPPPVKKTNERPVTKTQDDDESSNDEKVDDFKQMNKSGSKEKKGDSPTNSKREEFSNKVRNVKEKIKGKIE